VAGFKKYSQRGITVQVAQTARVDIVVEVGAATESITVTADADLLRTETAEQSTTVSKERIDTLPLNFSVTQGGAIRNPFSFVSLTPGAYMFAGQNLIRVNGAPTSTFSMMLEGQDATSPLTQSTNNHMEPSVDAVDELTLQTSSYAPEFGQVNGGLFNFTAKSGTNQFHGTAYEYFANDALNAGQPFTNDGHGDFGACQAL
jgi:hypothetical protein